MLLVGAAAFFLGVVQIGYRAHPDGSYAHREIVQALLAGSGFAAAVAVLLGAARGWSAPTLAVLAAGGSLAAGLGLLLLLRSLWKPARPRLLAWPATAVSVGLIAFYLSVWLLGGP
ncbi:MAG: hypothetical protein D6731_05580 [Planctomycetota bacterium]|nr:MAG: hypothetical protein D6731_05580 [Planctomycetota bacterium]